MFPTSRHPNPPSDLLAITVNLGRPVSTHVHTAIVRSANGHATIAPVEAVSASGLRLLLSSPRRKGEWLRAALVGVGSLIVRVSSCRLRAGAWHVRCTFAEPLSPDTLARLLS
jgi:hypothetical protein